MTTSTTLILGIGASSVILFFFLLFLDKKNPAHMVIRAITIIFIIFNLVLIPKATLDDGTICEVVVNTSNDLNSTATHYTYTDFCYDRDETTNNSFFKSYNWYWKVFIIWMLFYLLFYMYMEGKKVLDMIVSFFNKRR